MCTHFSECKAILLSCYYIIPGNWTSFISDSDIEFKDEDYSAPPAGAAGYPKGPAMFGLTGGSGSNALLSTYYSVSLSMRLIFSLSVYTCLGADRQGWRWVDDTFHIVPIIL